ncbi:MAG: hypothetical protein K2Q15_14690, partial [Burkholderiales bacterium]|nr:hypothetical protein [Burkholderiales bacterium]
WSLIGIIIRNWDSICAGASTAWQWVKDKAIAAGQGMIDFFMNWSLIGVIIRNWDSITAFMSGLVTSFVTIGGQIMDGLIQGFMGGIHYLKSAINGVGESAIGWFKEKLGIHSPSRVFAELGAFTMQGFSNGLSDTQKEPLAAIQGITSKIISAASGLIIGGTSLGAMADVKLDQRPPMAAQTNYGQSPAPSFQITIHAAPGMNEQALAQLVAQEIAKADRQKQVRSRSRLGDSD